jgi:acyl-CoA dehydrogenase
VARRERAELAEAVSGVLGKDPNDWATLARLGFTSLTMPEELGGSGGDLNDAAVVVAEGARHASPLPLAEALFLACPLLAAAGLELPAGILTASPELGTDLSGSRLAGTLRRLTSVRSADYLVMLAGSPGGPAVAVASARAAGLTVKPGENLAGEQRDTATLAGVLPEQAACLPEGDWPRRAELLGAAARAVQIGGAASAILDLAVTHTRDRVQFGKPLNRLQAVQQLLARLAADTTTVTVAADAAVRALASGSPGAEILVAAAKAVASALAVDIARAGHQLHGAIGYTQEHRLGAYTKRLWSWRQEFGNELYWQRRMASLIDGASGDVWPLITSTEGLTG